jgi:hypothetical protein
MPVYLRLFYYKKLVKTRKEENEQMEKAKKGNTSKGIKRPTFNKPSSKSTNS